MINKAIKIIKIKINNQKNDKYSYFWNRIREYKDGKWTFNLIIVLKKPEKYFSPNSVSTLFSLSAPCIFFYFRKIFFLDGVW